MKITILPPPPGDDDNGQNGAENRRPNTRSKPGSRNSRNSGETTESPWSARVASVSGIPIRLHFTFFLVIIWFALANISQMGHVGMLLAVLGLFICVALHELGHSLVAQRLGYPVHDITLYPIGGVASIEGSPKPKDELLIAVAGPAVNVVIAAVFYFVLPLMHRSNAFSLSNPLIGDPWEFVYHANIMLAAFNLLIPAFPMDGGRVLRALLGMVIGKYRATRIAAGIGQVIAVLMGLTGLGILSSFWAMLGVGAPAMAPNYGLVLIAFFVYFAAAQERDLEVTENAIDGAKIEAAMVRDFQTLSVGDTLRRAAEQLLATNQQDFPVTLGDEVQGVLTRNQLLRALATNDDTAYVAGAMERDILFARPDDPLDEFMLRPDGIRRAPVLVRDPAGNLIGMVTSENAMEFLMLRQIARSREAAGGRR